MRCSSVRLRRTAFRRSRSFAATSFLARPHGRATVCQPETVVLAVVAALHRSGERRPRAGYSRLAVERPVCKENRCHRRSPTSASRTSTGDSSAAMARRSRSRTRTPKRSSPRSRRCHSRRWKQAVLAARRAFDSGGWSGLRREERIDAVIALGEYLAGRSEELGATLTAEAGSTVSMLGAQVGMPLAHLRAACEIYRTMPDVEHTPRPLAEVILGNRVTASMMRYEPIGVVSRDRRLQLPAADAAVEVRACAADGQHRHRAAEPAHADRHARDRGGGRGGRAAGRCPQRRRRGRRRGRAAAVVAPCGRLRQLHRLDRGGAGRSWRRRRRR